MLELIFGMMLVTAGLNDPGLQDKGLDGRMPQQAQVQVTETAEPGEEDALPGGAEPQAVMPPAGAAVR